MLELINECVFFFKILPPLFSYTINFRYLAWTLLIEGVSRCIDMCLTLTHVITLNHVIVLNLVSVSFFVFVVHKLSEILDVSTNLSR